MVQKRHGGSSRSTARGPVRAPQVAVQVLDLRAGMRGQGDVGMQREAVPKGAPDPLPDRGGGAKPAPAPAGGMTRPSQRIGWNEVSSRRQPAATPIPTVGE